MTVSEPPVRRRFTIVEALVVSALVAVLIAIAVPLLREKNENRVILTELQATQAAVERYFRETQAYPTLPSSPKPETTPVNPWNAGGIPAPSSVPPFAGIDFLAEALKLQTEERVKFSPDYLKDLPKHAGEMASDGTKRWRLDSQGKVYVEMDGRTY